TVDFRSDQFSLGLILYELLTGKNAFRRDTPGETVAAILRDEPPSLNTQSSAAPPPLRWVIERCLAKDPVERYSHSTDLYRELRGERHVADLHARSGRCHATANYPFRRLLPGSVLVSRRRPHLLYRVDRHAVAVVGGRGRRSRGTGSAGCLSRRHIPGRQKPGLSAKRIDGCDHAPPGPVAIVSGGGRAAEIRAAAHIRHALLQRRTAIRAGR